ncbi:CDP-diacylglycerol diphosphatase [Herbaspirillum lusitanum]|uniref:CDP-diacylglycerol pyrophosphatase n=1 Tax=Herbaspirillum lusitanum TaxID=213312 RepID=A0ABW9A8Y8_9BURK
MLNHNRILILLLSCCVIGLAGRSTSAVAKPANPDKLWEIISQECLPNSIAHNHPAPCSMVDREHGFAILKDIVGRGQFLLIPTQRLSGIESPQLQSETIPNYWRHAWEQRARVGAALGRSLAREQIGLEINSAAARSQLQLHIHIDCMRPDLPGQLRAHAADPLERWMPFMLEGHQYFIMRLPADALERLSPFRLAAATTPQAARMMGAQSLLLTGAYFEDGSEGFYLINMPVNFERGERGSAEVLLDHDCAIAD